MSSAAIFVNFGQFSAAKYRNSYAETAAPRWLGWGGQGGKASFFVALLYTHADMIRTSRRRVRCLGHRVCACSEAYSKSWMDTRGYVSWGWLSGL